MSVAQLALAAGALAAGGALQGTIGFGSMLVAAPVLVLIDPHLVPAPASVAAAVLVVLIALRDRASIELRGVGWTLAGRVPGTLLGGVVVAALSRQGLEIAFGVVLLAAVALSARSGHVERTPAVMLGVGAISGLMGTTTSVGGPPLALVYQRESGPTIRATLNTVFVFGSALSLATLAAVGELGGRELGWGLAITPGVVLGFLASGNLTRHVDARSLRPAVVVLAGASALAVLVRALV